MPATTQYEIPLFGEANSRIHGWSMEAVSEGEAWLTAQRPAVEWQSVVDLLSATDPASELLGQSNTEYNKAQRIARELVAGLSSFRYEGEIEPIADRELYKQAHILTRLDREWSASTHAYDAYRSFLQYSTSLGTGYMTCTWDKNFYGPFRGDIRQEAIDPQCVTFLQLPKDSDIQRAYATIIRYELPINLAKSIYAQTNRAFADALIPDRDSPGWLIKGLQKVQSIMGGSPALRVAGGRHKSNISFPTVDIFHMYVTDRSINMTGSPITMGKPDSNWTYVVPSLGDPIPTGQRNPATGQSFTRPAQDHDCRLFPLRRLLIFARCTEIICSDGSSPWWHGLTPLVRLRFNDLPWEALGRSCVGNIRTLQLGVNRMLRGIEDSVEARLDPPAEYNDANVSAGFAAAFNPRRAGVRVATDFNAGENVRFPVDPGTYDVGNWIPEHIKDQEARMDYLTGVQDLTAIAKARQLPSADALEKLLEMAGPIVQDMIRQVEDPLQRLGHMRIALNFQFMTYPRILQQVGDEADEKYDYVPDKLIPRIDTESVEQRTTRAKLYLHQFAYRVSQSGINEINRMSMKLFYLQLMKTGFPISWWQFAKVAQIPNFGPPPADTHTVMEEWVAQQRIMMELQGDAAGELAQAEGQVGGAPNPEGRPPTNSKPARIVSKDGGARSTVATS